MSTSQPDRPYTATSGAPGSSDAAQDLKGAAADLGQQAKQNARASAEQLRHTAADKVEALAGTMQNTATELQGSDVGQLAGYVSSLAEGMTRFSRGLRDKSGEELLQDVTRLARENPALFITGSIALGLGLSRFARASTADARQGADQDSALTTQEDMWDLAHVDPQHTAAPFDNASLGAGSSAAGGAGYSTGTATPTAAGRSNGGSLS